MYVRVQNPILSLFINYFIWFYGAISTGGPGDGWALCPGALLNQRAATQLLQTETPLSRKASTMTIINVSSRMEWTVLSEGHQLEQPLQQCL